MSAIAGTAAPAVRRAAVAGSFYPADPGALRSLVGRLLDAADRRSAPVESDIRSLGTPLGLLVPHAGLQYSGVVAAAGWRLLRDPDDGAGAGAPADALSVVLLGTNHRATWLRGVAAWDEGTWRTPAGEHTVDGDLAAAIIDLGAPFHADRESHLGEHSIEVQLPLLGAVAPGALIVPLAVAAGTGAAAIRAGEGLGALLAARLREGQRIVLAISSDMAHYPGHDACARATAERLPAIIGLDPERLAWLEDEVARTDVAGLACGMCGIDPAVLGLAALRAAGAARGVALASATSADAGGPRDRTVGYLAAGFGTTDR